MKEVEQREESVHLGGRGEKRLKGFEKGGEGNAIGESKQDD